MYQLLGWCVSMCNSLQLLVILLSSSWICSEERATRYVS
jgi:hypothetical protein